VFVTAIYPLLYHLGLPLLAHLTDFYEGRFSRLIGRMDAWAEREGLRPPFAAGLVPEFLAAEWGQDHYLVSLARYLLTGARLSGRLDEGRQAAGPELYSGETADGHAGARLAPAARRSRSPPAPRRPPC
jgi:hypothetical protein